MPTISAPSDLSTIDQCRAALTISASSALRSTIQAGLWRKGASWRILSIRISGARAAIVASSGKSVPGGKSRSKTSWASDPRSMTSSVSGCHERWDAPSSLSNHASGLTSSFSSRLGLCGRGVPSSFLRMARRSKPSSKWTGIGSCSADLNSIAGRQEIRRSQMVPSPRVIGRTMSSGSSQPSTRRANSGSVEDGETALPRRSRSESRMISCSLAAPIWRLNSVSAASSWLACEGSAIPTFSLMSATSLSRKNGLPAGAVG